MADTCVDIKLERVRAYIQIGQHYYVTTGTDDQSSGSIMSFSINKSRGQAVATFRCQLAAWVDAPIKADLETITNGLGPRIIVYAGVGTQSNTSLPRLFTGYVTNITQDPHWEDARKFILNISGEDEFALMKRTKFSRRFKMGDDAFAVITGGKRREGGRMTKLRRAAAGKSGVTFHSAGSNSSLEHSPLIKTPDPQGTSPKAPAYTGGSSKKPEEAQSPVTVVPPVVTLRKNDTQKFVFYDKDGNPIDLKSLANTAAPGCLFCARPSPQQLSGGGTSTGAAGLKEGEKTFPVSIKYIAASTGVDPGVLVTMTADYPTQITFIHPLTGQTATINMHQISPHSHRDIPDGGPAVGTFDSFGV